MERVHGTHKVSKLASEDVISSMPENVITNILNRLRLQDAVRTSILARNWRFKWTLLTKLVFYNISKHLQLHGPDSKKCYDGRIISRLLLHLKGPITKFVLSIPLDLFLDVEDLNHWVLFLSRKGIKKFKLDYEDTTPFKLPTHLFSCLELTHLKVGNCFFQPPPTFCGFPNLLSLHLIDVSFGSYRCVEFLTQCPLLEILNIAFHDTTCNVSMGDIATLQNLKKLYLPLGGLEDTTITISAIFQLLDSLPKLEELHFDLLVCNFVDEAFARKRIPTSFPCLKTLTLQEIDFCDEDMITFASALICGLPYLQKLVITGACEFYVPPAELISPYVDSNTMRQLQLESVEFAGFRGLEDEIDLIERILACSPLLKTFAIYSSPLLMADQRLILARNLLKFHRASPIAEVDFR